jgi:pathogenesis-related protein 1
MSRLGSGIFLVLLVLASAGAAAAQVSLRGPQSTTGFPAASVGTSSGAPSETPGATGPSEPKSVAGMLSAQNAARARLNLPPLAWSADLTAAAESTAKSIAETACSRAHAERAGGASSSAVYWAPGVRGLDGRGRAQDLSASYVVSEWIAGRADYDPVRGECRRTGACEQYARMVEPPIREVGCAKAVCSSQAQVWACHYLGEQPDPPKPHRLRAN